MKEVFIVKQILNEMDRLGPDGTGPISLARKAAFNLYIYENDPVIDTAIKYLMHELSCFALGQKPEPLAKFIMRDKK